MELNNIDDSDTRRILYHQEIKASAKIGSRVQCKTAQPEMCSGIFHRPTLIC